MSSSETMQDLHVIEGKEALGELNALVNQGGHDLANARVIVVGGEISGALLRVTRMFPVSGFKLRIADVESGTVLIIHRSAYASEWKQSPSSHRRKRV